MNNNVQDVTSMVSLFFSAQTETITPYHLFVCSYLLPQCRKFQSCNVSVNSVISERHKLLDCIVEQRCIKLVHLTKYSQLNKITYKEREVNCHGKDEGNTRV